MEVVENAVGYGVGVERRTIIKKKKNNNGKDLEGQGPFDCGWSLPSRGGKCSPPVLHPEPAALLFLQVVPIVDGGLQGPVADDPVQRSLYIGGELVAHPSRRVLPHQTRWLSRHLGLPLS